MKIGYQLVIIRDQKSAFGAICCLAAGICVFFLADHLRQMLSKPCTFEISITQLVWQQIDTSIRLRQSVLVSHRWQPKPEMT